MEIKVLTHLIIVVRFRKNCAQNNPHLADIELILQQNRRKVKKFK